MKNWKHYLSECILLFVAVTLGFLTDNWRESLADRRLEKKYLTSLIADLRSDLKNFDILKANLQDRAGELDTVIHQLDSGAAAIRSAWAHEKIFAAEFLFSPTGFQPANVTLKLLENEGFRLIRNREIVDDIMHYYYEDINRINTHYQFMMSENMEAVHSMQELYDFQLMDELWDPTTNVFRTPVSTARSLPPNPSAIFILRNQLLSQKRMVKRLIHHINRDSGHAREYIERFEKELSK